MGALICCARCHWGLAAGLGAACLHMMCCTAPLQTPLWWEEISRPVGSLSTCPSPAQPHGTPPHCSVKSEPCLTTRRRGRTSSPSPKMPSSRMWTNRKEAGELVLSLPFPKDVVKPCCAHPYKTVSTLAVGLCGDCPRAAQSQSLTNPKTNDGRAACSPHPHSASSGVPWQVLTLPLPSLPGGEEIMVAKSNSGSLPTTWKKLRAWSQSGR